MKHLDTLTISDINESESLVTTKQQIYINAKKEYLNDVADQLKKGGLMINKVKIGNDIDQFGEDDQIEIQMDKNKFTVTFSLRGVSLGAKIGHNLKNTSTAEDAVRGYSTSVPSLITKLKRSYLR